MLWKHLGGAKRMGEKCNTITLYASQADPVIEAIERNGVCYSKEAYVRKKYQESAKIFTTAYSWFVREMEKMATDAFPTFPLKPHGVIESSGNIWECLSFRNTRLHGSVN